MNTSHLLTENCIVFLQVSVDPLSGSFRIYRMWMVVNCRMMKIRRKSTGGTGPRSPPSSCTSSRERLRSRIILTCTAERSSRSRSACRRFECRWAQRTHTRWMCLRIRMTHACNRSTLFNRSLFKIFYHWSLQFAKLTNKYL